MTINWNTTKDKVNYYLIILIAFFLPLKKEVISPLIILFFLSSIWNRKSSIIQHLNTSYLLIVGFYLFGIVSLLYGSDLSNTIFNNEIKLSLLVFPLSFLLSKLDLKKIYRSIFKSFIEGIFLAVLLSILNSTIQYYYEKDSSVFFYDQLSYFSHASYFSMYLNFAIGLLYFFWFSPTKKDYLKPYLNFSLSFFFSIIVLLLASKTGILTLIAIHFIAGFYWVLRYKKIIQGLLLILSISTVIGVSLSYAPQSLNRIVQLKDTTKNFEGEPSSSTNIRIAVWKESYSLIKEKPILGYGTGDVMNVLTEKYKEKEYHELAKKHLNSHNQFIQILLGSGIVGLIYFLILLFYPFTKQLSPAQLLLYIIFLTLIIVNFMTESMLETQSGVIFFAFFITLFYSIVLPKEKSIDKI